MGALTTSGTGAEGAIGMIGSGTADSAPIVVGDDVEAGAPTVAAGERGAVGAVVGAAEGAAGAG